MRTHLLLVTSTLVALAGAVTAAADSQPYALQKDSEFQYGCFDPCACPIAVRNGVNGGFLLTPSGFDGLFFVYDVTDVAWLIPDGGDGIPVTGQGTYRIGGEFANQEQLALTLRVDGRDPRIFDSGLQTKVNQFPAINLAISAHAAYFFDTVFAVHAEPAQTTGIPEPSPSGPGLLSLQPNPTLGITSIQFSLTRACSASLTVFDVQGRRRVTLLDDRWLDAGPHRIDWSGIGDEGRSLPPGVYLVELQAAGRREIHRVIKLSASSSGRGLSSVR